ncbi:MAG TPA: hypothetical protein VHC50_00425 [Puia sp.]|jgi:hypothetical protein|nr:hypothetical protein [Puia sp.]
MTEEKNDKFPDEPSKPDTRKILDYLSGSLSEAERAQFESLKPDDPFFKEAMEGLKDLENKNDLPKLIGHLNQQLHQHLAHNKYTGRKKKIRFGDWIYWSIGIILLLALAGFLVLRLLLKH